MILFLKEQLPPAVGDKHRDPQLDNAQRERETL